MQKRFLPAITNQESSTTINFFEILRWVFYYGFCETALPFFFDPLQLKESFLGVPLLDWFEIFYFLIIPNLVIFLSHITSPFASTYGLLLYLFLTSDPINFIYRYFYQDFFILICILPVLFEFLAITENEDVFHDDEF